MPSLKEYVEKAKRKGYSKEDLAKDLIRKGYSKEEIDEAFGTSKRKIMREIASLQDLNYMEKVKNLFVHPSDFFEGIREDKITNAFLLFLIVEVIASFLTIGAYFTFFGFISEEIRFFNLFNLFGFSYIIFFFVSGIGATFIYAGISHLIIQITGGSGSFIDSYNVCTYSLIPFALFFIIPYIGWLSIIYSIILMTFGLSFYHDISKGKAVIAALAPIILVVIFFVLLINFIFLYSFNVF